MHSLLLRQIKRFFGSPEAIPKECQGFVAAVDQAYLQFDDDREMLERSLELSSDELLQANSELRGLLSTIPDLFFRLDADGAITYLQIGSDKDLFVSSQHILGKRIQDIPLPQISDLFRTSLEKVKATGEMVQMEYSLEIADSLHFYEARLLPLVQNQTMVIIRNTTEAKRSEQALIEEKELLSVTLRSICDGVITTDADCNIRLINLVAENLTGWKSAEAVGRPLHDIFTLQDQDCISCPNPVNKTLTSGLPSEIELNSILIDRFGNNRAINTSAAPINDQQNRTVGAVLAFRDITEKLKHEEEMLKGQKLESVGVLAGGIAHDFNNILNGILGNITLAKMDCEPESKIHIRLTRAENASYQARDLTQQLLTVAKGGAPIIQTAHLDELLRDTTEFALSGSNVNFVLEMDKELTPADIDRGQVSQVINNLIINADQAMPDGGTIHIQAFNINIPQNTTKPLAAGDYVKISISDQGTGIAKEHLSQIFDPYFTTKEHGSGLGLATSYSIIHNHGGYITVESVPGKGTTFTFFLPASRDQQPVSHEPSELPQFEAPGRILLMDNESVIQEVNQELLEMLGFEADCVNDGLAAIRAYQQAIDQNQPYDAVMMDLTVPGGTGGKEAIGALLEIDPDIKAIVTSGYSHNEVLSDYKSFGFKAVLIKPFKVEDLAHTLYRLLTEKD